MNPFERWDDWEWERAVQEVGKEQGLGKSELPFGQSKGRLYRPGKARWGASLKYWNGTQKRTVLAASLFLLVFFSANGSDPFSKTVYAIYRGAMYSSDYYESLNGMAKEALSLGGIANTNVPVDVKMKGQFFPPISGKIAAEFGAIGKGGSTPQGSVHYGIDVESALGVQVVAPGAGIVSVVGEDPQLGKVVKLDCGDGWTAVLGNLGDIFVVQGQQIEKGSILGTVGLSAPLKKPWLHFELRKDDVPVNPLPYLTSSQT